MSYNTITAENGVFVYMNDMLVGRCKGPVTIDEHNKYDLTDTLAGCVFVMNEGAVVFRVCNGYGRDIIIGTDEQNNREIRTYITI
jgi:hypothetical protein